MIAKSAGRVTLEDASGFPSDRSHDVPNAPEFPPDSRRTTRVHPEPEDALRSPFEQDRHRILSSTAFRRLEHKTQVFAPSLGDHFRTRLTHTLEVAHLARCLARTLSADEHLAEVIALAHDLGHPPFGHAGEAALNDTMRGHGGFNHNVHSLRVVQYLEHPFPAFRGLNLTMATLHGLAAHVTRYDTPATMLTNDANDSSRDRKGAVPLEVGSAVRTFLSPPPPSPREDRGGSSAYAHEPLGRESSRAPSVEPLVRESFLAPSVERLVRESLLATSVEAEIVSLADRIAYNLHDLEDAIGAELLTLDDLATLEPWRAAYGRIASDHSDPPVFAIRRPVIDAILDALLTNAVTTSRAVLAAIEPVETSTDAMLEPSARVSLSPSGERTLLSLEEFLIAHVYRHPEIARTDAEGREIVRALFDRFLSDPALLPPRFRSRVVEQGPHRVICDYIAGMTDRFCKSEHGRLAAGT